MATKLEPPIAVNSVTSTSDRRAATVGGVAVSTTPVIGAATYAKLAQAALSGKDTATLSPKLLKLAHARNALYQALLLTDGAIRQVNPQVKGGTPDSAAYNALRSVRKQVEDAFKAFPLEVR
jgi:transaldolase